MSTKELLIWVEKNKPHLTERALDGSESVLCIMENFALLNCSTETICDLTMYFLFNSVESYINEQEDNFKNLLK